MFGSFVDMAMQIPRNMHAEEMQDDSQAFNRQEAIEARDFNSAEAVRQREWVEKQSNTAYQRSMSDMRAAGLNPMLASRVGGADVGSGAVASGSHASSGIGGPTSQGSSFASGRLADSQVEVNSAIKARTEAETDSIREDIKTKPVAREKIGEEIKEVVQKVSESIARVGLIGQQERTSAAEAGKLHQETANLLEEIPRIRALVRSLDASSALMRSQSKEVQQRVAAALPFVERQLKIVEIAREKLRMPKERQSSEVAESFLGKLKAIIDALNPLGSLFK